MCLRFVPGTLTPEKKWQCLDTKSMIDICLRLVFAEDMIFGVLRDEKRIFWMRNAQCTDIHLPSCEDFEKKQLRCTVGCEADLWIK